MAMAMAMAMDINGNGVLDDASKQGCDGGHSSAGGPVARALPPGTDGEERAK